MTDEDLENLTQELSGQIEQLPDDPENPPSKAEKKHRLVLQTRRQALDRIKEAKEKGNISQEARVCMEYALITEYGERNALLFYLMKVRLANWLRL